MKRLFLAALFLVLAVSNVSCGAKLIEPGYEGIRVNLVGGHRGAEDYPIITGRVWFNSFTEAVYDYPTFKHNYVWTKSGSEGAKNVDESMTFNSIEGTPINADVGCVLNVKPGATPHLFISYRVDMPTLINGVVRNEVRKYLGERASKMKIMDIIGSQKGALLDSVRQDLNDGPLAQFIDFETLSFTSSPRVPEGVQQAVNQVNQSIAEANNAVALVQKVRAEADQKVALARGDSASVVIAAKGTAEANLLIQKSLTPELIRLRMIEKWNGTVPSVTGGTTPIIDLRSGKDQK